MGEERVERLRQELKELQKKREESFLKPPSPPPYVPPAFTKTSADYLNANLSPAFNWGNLDKTTAATLQEVIYFKLSLFFDEVPFILKVLASSQQQPAPSPPPPPPPQQNPRQLNNNGIPSSILLSNLNSINHIPAMPGGVCAAFRVFFYTLIIQ